MSNKEKTSLDPVLKKFITYNPHTGEIFVHKRDSSKRVIQNEDQYIICTVEGIKLKIKAVNLIWFLVHGKLPKENQVIYHKNLDTNDLSLSNLGVVTKNEYKLIREAIANLNGDLRISQNKNCNYSYVLHYRTGGRVQKEIIQDSTAAKNKLKRLKARCVRLLGRYILTE